MNKRLENKLDDKINNIIIEIDSYFDKYISICGNIAGDDLSIVKDTFYDILDLYDDSKFSIDVVDKYNSFSNFLLGFKYIDNLYESEISLLEKRNFVYNLFGEVGKNMMEFPMVDGVYKPKGMNFEFENYSKVQNVQKKIFNDIVKGIFHSFNDDIDLNQIYTYYNRNNEEIDINKIIKEM